MVYAAGPRLERRFLARVVVLDDPAVPVAETYRRIRSLADQMGVPRPSYERIRIHVQGERARRAKRSQARSEARELLLQLAFNSRRPDAVVRDLLSLLEEREVPSYKL
jgi:hypothetical protein